MKMKNRLITFSGADCCGKSTQIQLLKEYFDNNNIKYYSVWSRGGCTPGIEFLKSLVRRGKKMSDEEKIADSVRIHKNPRKSRLLLMLSIIDICLYYGIYIRLKLIKSNVICDRYMWDALIDFMIKYSTVDVEHGFTWKLFSKLCTKPDISFVFYVSPEEASLRGEKKHERNAENLEQRIFRNNLYTEKISRNKWMYSIDSKKTIEQIHNEIIEIMSDIDRH